MRAFIIRPFGTKHSIDFERVDSELIQPALRELARHDAPVDGATTGAISEQGNIREDMFRLIAVSDLVIADVSIHNANVFYELGMRHALCSRHTVLIRSKTEQPYPFDLQTDRYFLYDAANPGADVAGLVRTLQTTLASDHPDSPMFSLLPALAPHGRGQLVSVPPDFLEDLRGALTRRHRGELRLYASEVVSFEWDQEGLIAIGDAQFKLRAFAGARATFELLLRTDPHHLHANLRLGTIYQRLAVAADAGAKWDLLERSRQAIDRVLARHPPVAQRVEVYCLLASNEKTRWIDELAPLRADERRLATLRSEHFSRMLKLYLTAANQDLNAHYPAINALAWLTVQLELAKALPDDWDDLHETPAIAAAALAGAAKLAGHLVSTLQLALELDDFMGPRGAPGGTVDDFVHSSRADFLLLTNSERVTRVQQAYRKALTGADRFTLEATRRNLDIYAGLAVFEPGVSAAIGVIAGFMDDRGKPAAEPHKVLLFTGHMVDAKDKPAQAARFPRTAAATARARALILAAVRQEVAGRETTVLGIAGGACGGDILFHEVCAELGVATELYLALPEDQFQAASVQQGGADWVERYHALVRRLAPHVLQQTRDVPKWLVKKAGYDIWQRNNMWMLFSALSSGARERSMIALYNQEREPDGPGGTAHLLGQAEAWGFKIVPVDARPLLD